MRRLGISNTDNQDLDLKWGVDCANVGYVEGEGDPIRTETLLDPLRAIEKDRRRGAWLLMADLKEGVYNDKERNDGKYF